MDDERLTPSGSRVLGLLNQVAQSFNHEVIGTEHLLLVIARAERSIAAQVLNSFGIDQKSLRIRIEKLVRPGAEMVTVSVLPRTPRLNAALRRAMGEADRVDQQRTGPEHLLLGLLQDRCTSAAIVLTSFGVRLDEVCEAVISRCKRA